VAGALESAAFATLLLDLLMPDEESVDQRTREYRFNIDMLGERVVGAIDWMRTRPDLRDLPLALSDASTGAAAALMPRRHVRTRSEPSSRAVGGPIWRIGHSRTSKRRRC
jgi:hypothetical protein